MLDKDSEAIRTQIPGGSPFLRTRVLLLEAPLGHLVPGILKRNKEEKVAHIHVCPSRCRNGAEPCGIWTKLVS